MSASANSSTTKTCTNQDYDESSLARYGMIRSDFKGAKAIAAQDPTDSNFSVITPVACVPLFCK